jgi:hypothetical protein
VAGSLADQRPQLAYFGRATANPVPYPAPDQVQDSAPDARRPARFNQPEVMTRHFSRPCATRRHNEALDGHLAEMRKTGRTKAAQVQGGKARRTSQGLY